MPLIIPPGFCEIAIEMVNEGDPDPWYVTWGVDSSGAGGDIVAIGEYNLGAMDPWLHLLSNQCQITGAFVTMGQDGPFPIRQFVPTPSPRVGLNAGNKLPQNCALLVRKNSAMGGRRARGRFFLPGVLNEGSVDNVGRIGTSDFSPYRDSATEMFSWLQATGPLPNTPMVILHTSGGPTPMIDPTPVTSLSTDQVISTQRRRLR